MQRPRRLMRAAIAAAVLLSTTACGDAPKVVRAKDNTISLVQSEYAFRPMAFRADKGVVTILVRNEGRLGHNLAILRNRREIARASTQKPGLTSRIEPDLPAGDYKLVCTVANHEELGMYGTLTVR